MHLVIVLAGVTSLHAQVTFDRILKANEEPQNWLTYSGNLNGQHHSLLNQITPANVNNLDLQWVLQVRVLAGSDKFEATPLVVDGVMYTVRPPNEVVALDAATGHIFWTFAGQHTITGNPRLLRTREDRGLAIHGDTLFLATLDARLIALDAKTGRVLWNMQPEGAKPELGYSFTSAPLVVKDKV